MVGSVSLSYTQHGDTENGKYTGVAQMQSHTGEGMVRRDCTADLLSQSHVKQCGNAIAAPTDQTQRLSYGSHNNGLRANVPGSTLTTCIPGTGTKQAGGFQPTRGIFTSVRNDIDLSDLTLTLRQLATERLRHHHGSRRLYSRRGCEIASHRQLVRSSSRIHD